VAACCYSGVAMARKKTQLDVAVERTAQILEGHLATLPSAQAKAMRAKLHALAVKSSRAKRGKTSRSPKSAGPRLLSRASAKFS
jgi:hypothetical protein